MVISGVALLCCCGFAMVIMLCFARCQGVTLFPVVCRVGVSLVGGL